MATCGCSHLETFRILVNFHIPFCSTEEMLRRTVGAYLTQQYFVMRDGGKPDWELRRLEAIFSNLAQLNQDFVYFATSSLFAADLTAQVDRLRPYLLNAR